MALSIKTEGTIWPVASPDWTGETMTEALSRSPCASVSLVRRLGRTRGQRFANPVRGIRRTGARCVRHASGNNKAEWDAASGDEA